MKRRPVLVYLISACELFTGIEAVYSVFAHPQFVFGDISWLDVVAIGILRMIAAVALFFRVYQAPFLFLTGYSWYLSARVVALSNYMEPSTPDPILIYVAVMGAFYTTVVAYLFWIRKGGYFVRFAPSK